MRRWRALLLGAVFVGAFSALAVLVVREKELRGWLADTAPLAQWAVAAGTFTLALATFILARRASEEARAIGEEAAVVAEQVALQREQAGLAARPIAYPTVTPLWTPGPRRKDWLLVRNGGLGPAISVHGMVYWKPIDGAEAQAVICDSGALGPGEERWFRLAEPGVVNWHDARGALEFGDIHGRTWRTYFTVILEPGEIAVLRVHSIEPLS